MRKVHIVHLQQLTTCTEFPMRTIDSSMYAACKSPGMQISSELGLVPVLWTSTLAMKALGSPKALASFLRPRLRYSKAVYDRP